MHSRFIDLALAGKKAYAAMESQRPLYRGVYSKLPKLDFDNKDEAAIKVDLEYLYRDEDLAGTDCKSLVTVLYYCSQMTSENKAALYQSINSVTFKNPDKFEEFIKLAKEFINLSESELRNLPAEVKPTPPSAIAEVLADAFRRSEKLATEKNELKKSIDELKAETTLLSENREQQLKLIDELERNKQSLEAQLIETELSLLQKLSVAQEKIDSLSTQLAAMEGEVERKTSHLKLTIRSQEDKIKAKDIFNRLVGRQIDEAKENIGNITDKVTTLSRTITELSADKTKAEAKIAELNTYKTRAEAEIAELNTYKTKAEAEITKLKAYKAKVEGEHKKQSHFPELYHPEFFTSGQSASSRDAVTIDIHNNATPHRRGHR